MKEDGSRLSISIALTGDSFSIADMLTGKSIIYKKGNFVCRTIDIEVVTNHIKNLQEALVTYKPRRAFGIKSIGTEGNIVIQSNAHFDWSVSYSGISARLTNNTLKYKTGFERNVVLRQINKLYSTLLTANTILDPKRHIVRRISDIGAIVWKYKGHSILTYEQYVANDYITNCLVDGIPYDQIFITIDKEEGTAQVLDGSLELIFETPLDDSILLFHKGTSDIFDTKEVVA